MSSRDKDVGSAQRPNDGLPVGRDGPVAELFPLDHGTVLLLQERADCAGRALESADARFVQEVSYAIDGGRESIR